MESIQDVCREKRKALGMSSQEVAEKSGVSLSTVNNFFAAASKLPSSATVGAICAALGVSLDAFYGISEPPDAGLIRQLEQEREESAQLLSHEREKIAMLQNTVDRQLHNIKTLRHIIFALLVILALAFVYGITLDILNPDMGLFRGGM